MVRPHYYEGGEIKISFKKVTSGANKPLNPFQKFTQAIIGHKEYDVEMEGEILIPQKEDVEELKIAIWDGSELVDTRKSLLRFLLLALPGAIGYFRKPIHGYGRRYKKVEGLVNKLFEEVESCFELL
ncbi:MAG: hypothetical protein DRP03_02575 [Candidatus Aenigmatarchaeota archaeon]|nr:MAG: hypothetical protein DRP03_02575 [Candidatus Aenigmarchaeota archaeon]